MNFLTILIAPLALLAPVLAPVPTEPEAGTQTAALTLRDAPGPAAPPPFLLLEDAQRVPVQQQVSIEQRVIIRIAPSMADPRPRLSGGVSADALAGDNIKEEKLKGCLPIAAIAAITPADDNRLLILLRDRQILSATLEKSCNPDEFYSGAYVERNADGKLCPKRERLQSRMGSKCQITRLNRLVPKD